MTPDALKNSIEYPDGDTAVVYLEVPPDGVVLLQAHFELYEGLGIVRTLSTRDRLVCVLTTKNLLDECLAAICALASGTRASESEGSSDHSSHFETAANRSIAISPVDCVKKLGAPDSPEGRNLRDRYLGYFANAKNVSQV